MWCGHPNSSLGDQCRLSSGVRETGGSSRLYLLSVDPTGDGTAAVAIGNPDTAGHTAVLVPGVGSELDGIRGLINRASLLQDTAVKLDPTGPPVAVVAWLGYDTPSVDADIVTAPFGGKSEAGARALDGFVDGLRAAHDSSPSHLTVIGHSYGSTVLGEAASTGDGIAADDAIAVGSPGMRVENADDFNLDARHVWAGAASDDTFVARPEQNARWLTGVPIVGGWFADGAVGIHGPAPHNPEFGGNVLDVDTSGHSDYWRPNSQVLNSQAAVIIGDYDAVALEHGKAP
ncbi:alpha/beta hydrolase [Micromonospora tulbaghiae]|uniref:alpha/beta hydrolase n=1 Tax=Micromonospora tulbaghiae TaxID=479978 RepID=UPI0036973AF5